ncbi:hypothetical protein Ancab_021392 [Ancistrocladus abbreviatus]
MDGVLWHNDFYLSGINVYMTQDDGDANAYISGYITSYDERLPNNEVVDATLSCLSNSSLQGSGDASSDYIDSDDPKVIDKDYASDSNVDDDTHPTYVGSKEKFEGYVHPYYTMEKDREAHCSIIVPIPNPTTWLPSKRLLLDPFYLEAYQEGQKKQERGS